MFNDKKCAVKHPLLRKQIKKRKLYADEMLRAYPSRSEAWELSVAAKCLADDKYDPSSDLEFLKKCPDYKYIFAPDPDGAIRRIAVSSTCGLTGPRRAQARFE